MIENQAKQTMLEGATVLAGNINKMIYPEHVVVSPIVNGLTVQYKGKQYYCKSVAQVAKLLKEAFPDFA